MLELLPFLVYKEVEIAQLSWGRHLSCKTKLQRHFLSINLEEKQPYTKNAWTITVIPEVYRRIIQTRMVIVKEINCK